MRLIVALSLLGAFTTFGCAKKRHSDPPPSPCLTGVNQSACSVDLSGHSLWKWEGWVKLVPTFTDAQLEGDVASTEADANPELKEPTFDIYWEFAKSADGHNLARRFLTVRTPKHTLTTVESGELQSIDGDKFVFVRQSSSCNGVFAITTATATTGDNLFYLRNDTGALKLDSTKIERPKPESLNQIFGDIITAVTVAPVVGMFEGFGQALQSLVGMNTFLSNAYGNYSAVPGGTVRLGQIGCFGPVNTFTKTASQMEDWSK